VATFVATFRRLLSLEKEKTCKSGLLRDQGTATQADENRRKLTVVPICTNCGHENPAGATFCNACAASLIRFQGSREQRKVVTVLFCDVAGSTALAESVDPEVLRALLARYFERMRGIVEYHGGVVEKFAGDAVMAVFGLPAVHEDDAVRALRSAAEMRDALPQLGIEGRLGVATGEIVTGTRERLATGDAVNVAARLEQAAQPGEILVGEQTLRLARHAAEVEVVEPLMLKGKREPVPAWRLLSVANETLPRPPGSVLVGREQELLLLADAWQRVRSDRRCELVSVVGEAGVGKSRLVAEHLARLEALVVRGRCLPYGEGITYWPVVEILEQLAPRIGDLELDSAVDDALEGLVAGDATVPTDEIGWAFRRMLEAIAVRQPLVVVFDDIQWGEEAFLDLIEQVVVLAAHAPIHLLCLSRPELLDRRPGWGGILRLAPLADADAERLIDARLAGRALEHQSRLQILAAAGGNPLFVEEMAAMLLESATDVVSVPPSIQALLAARLEQLDPAERIVLERAAVEGEIFHRGAVQTLTPEESHLTTRLISLVRKELIRPDRSPRAGQDGFRFRHLLIRDAAYAGLSKASRAELHERFASWLEEHAADLAELEEIAGYHLEQAYRYHTELAPSNDSVRRLGERAAERLLEAGRRASSRWDVIAAIPLLERAASLFERDDLRRLRLLPELATDLLAAKQQLRAEAVAREAVQATSEAADAFTQAHAQLAMLRVSWRDPAAGMKGEDICRAAIRTFEQLGDEAGLADAWRTLGELHGERYDMAAQEQALAKALAHASRANDPRAETIVRIIYGLALMEGPEPFDQISQVQQRNLEWARANRSRRLEAASLVLGGRLRAMQGYFDEARALVAQARALFEQLGITMGLSAVARWSGEVEELSGDFAAAEKEYRTAAEICERAGDRNGTGWVALSLARLADLQGRPEQAQKLARIGKRNLPRDDRWLRKEQRLRHAREMARREKSEKAVRLADEAVALATPPGAALERATTLKDAADVLASIGHADQAASIAREALQLYEQKGNLVAASRTRTMLTALKNADLSHRSMVELTTD
jgi:class 3 adenylate cyclase